MIGHYDAPTGREALIRFGPDEAAPLLILTPLFEEANRTRQFLVTVMRRLAEAGVASILPDLPGTNESPVATVDARLGHWQAALRALGSTYAPRGTVSVRAGALLDRFAGDMPHWRLAPETGARALRDMVRSTAMGGGIKASALEAAAQAAPTRLAGNLVDPELYNALNAAALAGSARVVRLIGDAGDADAHIAGTPLWRRAEPGSDAALVEGVVADIRSWLA